MIDRPITRQEFEHVVLRSWLNANPTATPLEIAQIQWRAKKHWYNGQRAKAKSPLMRGSENETAA